jgi:transketolase
VTTQLERGRKCAPGELRWRADWVRLKTIELVAVAGSGHYTSVFSCAEIFAVLYYSQLRIDPSNPRWPDRDRFLLGKGHAAIGLYPILVDLGYFPQEWLESYSRLGSGLGDHPDMKRVPGIDFSSGSIGHNLSVGVGMALAARQQRRDYRTTVMLGDAELNEGQVWEAAMSASHFDLGNLVAIVDRNRMGLDGETEEVMGVEPIAEKWRAFGWRVVEVDGHDVGRLCEAFDALPDTASGSPTCLIAQTRKGAGVSFMDLSLHWHLGFLGPRDRDRAEAELLARMRALDPQRTALIS